MKILGINYLSESSISYMVDGKLKFAISEERINRIKNWYGNPIKSIDEFIKRFNISIDEIDYIATHGIAIKKSDQVNWKEYLKKIKLIKNSNLNKVKKNFLIKKLHYRKKREIKATKRALTLINSLKKKYKKKIFVFDHHECHAASAAFFSGWKECYVLTADGWGDGYSSKLYKFKKNELNLVRSASLLDSLGYFYGSITKLLGFKPHRHEGKVLGLAAFGDPFKAYKDISKMISFDKKNKNFISHPENGMYLPLFENKSLKELLKKYKKKDIAAATQKRLEDIVVNYINTINKKSFKIALAGGVFSNVKLNQKIQELSKIKNIFVFPNMGDGGLSVGACALCHNHFKKLKSKKLKEYYLGFDYSKNEILREINSYKLKYKTNKNIHSTIAKKLNQGNIISIFQGKSEFGPRSLGNRSILARAIDPKINNLLNKKLGRTEFMPFAPITLDIQSKKMYLNFNKGANAAKYMTTTFNCTNAMKKKSPAAVHIDGTARPQILYKNQNPVLYDILLKYFKISKIPNLINTSFNMHEEPIVCNPKDAIRTFIRSKTDYLFIGKFLIKKK
tara:strand:- start:176 stop:1867 length:1692 start_codon:yes stop_codon:yes gene_type:complete